MEMSGADRVVHRLHRRPNPDASTSADEPVSVDRYEGRLIVHPSFWRVEAAENGPLLISIVVVVLLHFLFVGFSLLVRNLNRVLMRRKRFERKPNMLAHFADQRSLLAFHSDRDRDKSQSFLG